MGTESRTLTPKQKRFADEYLIDLNATAAYKRAGYAGKGKSAENAASRLLGNVGVIAYVASRQVKLQEKLEITQERVLAEYAKLAFLDPRKFYDEAGALIPVHKLDADTAAALAGMDVTEIKAGEAEIGHTKKIKIADKKGALDSIARTLGMFIDKTELTGKGGGPQEHKVDATLTPDEAYLRMIGR